MHSRPRHHFRSEGREGTQPHPPGRDRGGKHRRRDPVRRSPAGRGGGESTITGPTAEPRGDIATGGRWRDPESEGRERGQEVQSAEPGGPLPFSREKGRNPPLETG